MKLPMDLNNPIPSAVDQAAKLGSMAFMCSVGSCPLPGPKDKGTKKSPDKPGPNIVYIKNFYRNAEN
ncbi:hypothetical protein Hanom_Chr08g00708201 [Helianthus anomalus]